VTTRSVESIDMRVIGEYGFVVLRAAVDARRLTAEVLAAFEVGLPASGATNSSAEAGTAPGARGRSTWPRG
jgi:hypothetical protein